MLCEWYVNDAMAFVATQSRAIRGSGKAHKAYRHIEVNPGCNKLSVARAIAGDSRWAIQYGYTIVDNLLSWGLVVGFRSHGDSGEYELYASDQMMICDTCEIRFHETRAVYYWTEFWPEEMVHHCSQDCWWLRNATRR